MQLGRVIGHATATVKHSTLRGWRMLVVQPLDSQGRADGTPLLAIDHLGSSHGDRVILTGDGHGVREMIGTDNTPVRWAVIGLADET